MADKNATMLLVGCEHWTPPDPIGDDEPRMICGECFWDGIDRARASLKRLLDQEQDKARRLVATLSDIADPNSQYPTVLRRRVRAVLDRYNRSNPDACPHEWITSDGPPAHGAVIFATCKLCQKRAKMRTRVGYDEILLCRCEDA